MRIVMRHWKGLRSLILTFDWWRPVWSPLSAWSAGQVWGVSGGYRGCSHLPVSREHQETASNLFLLYCNWFWSAVQIRSYVRIWIVQSNRDYLLPQKACSLNYVRVEYNWFRIRIRQKKIRFQIRSTSLETAVTSRWDIIKIIYHVCVSVLVASRPGTRHIF